MPSVSTELKNLITTHEEYSEQGYLNDRLKSKFGQLINSFQMS